MKQKLKLSITLLIFSLLVFTSGSDSNTNCLILHEGTFTYGNVGNEVKVVIKGEDHTEYHNNGKYIIKSKLIWVSDCEYNMTMTEVTIPNFPYGIGDVMNVKIDKVKGNEIYYTSTVKGQSWKGKFTKIEP